MSDEQNAPSVPNSESATPGDTSQPQSDSTATAPASSVLAVAPKKSFSGLLIVLLILFAALLTVGGWFTWQQIDTRNRAVAKVDDATTLIENADVIVLEVDEIVRAEVTPEIGDLAAEVQPKVLPAIADLDEAAILLDVALRDLRAEDVPRAEALREAALARSEMLGTVAPILEGNIKAAASLTPALDGWAATLEGEELLDDAVVEYNKLTDAAVKKSRDISVQAEKKFQSAEELFSQAATAFPEADFTAYRKYLAGKQELVTLSKQADDAFLKGDKAKANDLSDDYNAKDKQLVVQAKSLPDTPAEIVADAYEAMAGEATDGYFKARDRAIAADKTLKDLEG